MGALDESGAFDQAGGGDFLDAQKFDADAECNDVDDRVDGSDFVECDVVGWHTVDFAFGFGDAREDCDRALFDELG